jgi:hypothetical protein
MNEGASVSDRIASALAALRRLHPDWRFGQMMANAATWAKGPAAEAMWDVEDEELLAAIEEHLKASQTRMAESR